MPLSSPPHPALRATFPPVGQSSAAYDSAGARAGARRSSRPTKGLPPCGGGSPVRTLGRKGETPRLLERLNLRMPPLSLASLDSSPRKGGSQGRAHHVRPYKKVMSPLIRPLIRPFGATFPPVGGKGLRAATLGPPNKITKEEFSCPPNPTNHKLQPESMGGAADKGCCAPSSTRLRENRRGVESERGRHRRAGRADGREGQLPALRHQLRRNRPVRPGAPPVPSPFPSCPV